MDKIHDVFAWASSMNTQITQRIRMDAEGNKKNPRKSKMICVICVLPSAFTDDFMNVFFGCGHVAL